MKQLSFICLFLGSFVLTAQDEEQLIAAGVLPYTYLNDSVYLLLGYDADKPGWTDFGGMKEWVGNLDNEKRLETAEEIAIREFYEECRMVYGKEDITASMDPNAYITAASGVYRSYVVKIPYKSRAEIRGALIPVDDKFQIFNEKSDFYWISLAELKQIIRSGSNVLSNSPNQGIIYKHFYSTLKVVLQDDSIDEMFKP